jgi:microcystin-dependent protein
MDPILGEICLVGFNFEPRDWMYCDGRELQISKYAALHSLLGTTYGPARPGYFKLPDLRECAIVGAGEGAGLTPRLAGQACGIGSVALSPDQMPVHIHPLSGTLLVTQEIGSYDTPDGTYLAGLYNDEYAEEVDNNTMAAGLVSGTAQQSGGGAAHPNYMPSLVLNYLICTNGNYPG